MCKFDEKKQGFHEIPGKNYGFRVIPRRFRDYMKSLKLHLFPVTYTFSFYVKSVDTLQVPCGSHKEPYCKNRILISLLVNEISAINENSK